MDLAWYRILILCFRYDLKHSPRKRLNAVRPGIAETVVAPDHRTQQRTRRQGKWQVGLIDQEGRAEMLSALGCVDYVVLFEDESVLGLVERVLPDVLVKADQYSASEVVGHEVIERNGGQVVRVPMKGIFSSSSLVEKIHQSAAQRC